MLINRLNSLLFSSIILLFSCEKDQHSKSIAKYPLEIISVDVSNKQSLLISDIYDSIRLVKLNGNPSYQTDEIHKIIVYADRIYIQCNQEILMYDSDGNANWKLSKFGEGPGEYSSLSDFLIDTVSHTIEIYSSMRKIVRYDLTDGSLVDEKRISLDGYSFDKLDSDTYVIYSGSAIYNKDSNYKLNYFSWEKGRIVNGFIPISKREASFMHFSDLTNFSRHENSLSFLYAFNDTIYSLSKGDILPRIFIDFGKSKLPYGMLHARYKDVMDFFSQCKASNYAFRLTGFFEANNLIISAFHHGSSFNHLYYNKLTNEVKVVDRIIYDAIFNGLEEKASFENLPKGVYRNETYIVIQAYDFIDRIETLIKNKIILPNRYKKHILEIYHNTKMHDDPILLIGKLKKKQTVNLYQ